MQNRGSNPLAVIVMGIFLSAFGLIGLIVGLIFMQIVVIIFSAIFAASGLIILLTGLAIKSANSAAAARLKNPSTIAYRTYGGHGNFVQYFSYINRKKKSSTNAAVNVLGVAGILFGVGGVIVSGQSSYDVFISDTELIINETLKNKRMVDALFVKIPAEKIIDLNAEFDGEYVTIFLKFANKNKNFTLDIPVKQVGEPDSIIETFMRLKSPTAQEESALPAFEKPESLFE